MADIASMLLGTTPLSSLTKGMSTGLSLGNQMEQSQRQREQMQLEKQSAAQQAQLAPQKLQMAQSQAKLENWKANNPELTLPGSVNPIAMLDYIGNKYGHDSPQYTQLENYQLKQDALDGAHTHYYNAQAENLLLDHMPSSVKEASESEMSDLGYPTSVSLNINAPERGLIEKNQIPYATWQKQGDSLKKTLPQAPNLPSAQESQSVSAQNNNIIQNQAKNEGDIFKSQLSKASLSSSQQAMLGRANTALQIMKEIEPNLDSFGQYLGGAGKVERMADQAGSFMGKSPSPDFLKYQNVVTLLPGLKNELSQAFGASKTKEEQAELEKVTSPAFWQNAPGYKNQFNTVKNLLENQRKMIGKPLSRQQSGQLVDAPAPSASTTGGSSVTMIFPGGAKKIVAQNLINQMKAAGGKITNG